MPPAGDGEDAVSDVSKEMNAVLSAEAGSEAETEAKSEARDGFLNILCLLKTPRFLTDLRHILILIDF